MPPNKTKERAFKDPNSTKSKLSAPIAPPEPFKLPPPSLEQFLPELSKKHVYITHIDVKTWEFKRKIFMVPLAMNILIILALLWRARSIGPYYMKICFSITGKVNEMTLDTRRMTSSDIAREILRRASKFMADLLLYIFVWPWPRDFFAGRVIGNPIAWRFGVGFRDKEIIVRRSRKWINQLGNVFDDNSPGTQLLYSNIRQAVDPIWMNEKTGYLMLNKEWDLDWKSMVLATKLVDQRKMALDDFKTTVLVYNEEFGWMASGVVVPQGSVAEEEGRRKIIAFKDELTAMGKENLFFKWIELVQFESSKPGAFGSAEQEKTTAKAKAMFEAQGVDFDQFWAKIGGMQGMPGMDRI
ncbi:hypothetical protein BJ878DRAFT_421942 [Calycina marina]|uniref:Uncharacterized protein n=1 Tax=Calycina marina TaxID=1763456 RepID=A0A9P7Z3F8_9HELO|nr:hypothetical protein BJ878DRAFT_421942 [Calycina marina]